MILQQRSPSGQVGLSSSKNKLFNTNSAVDGVNIQEKEIEKLQNAADENSAKMVEYRNEIESLRRQLQDQEQIIGEKEAILKQNGESSQKMQLELEKSNEQLSKKLSEANQEL